MSLRTSERPVAERCRFRGGRYKWLVDADEAPRRRREEVFVDLIKRRPMTVMPQSVLQGLGSDDTAVQLEAMREVNKVLSVEQQSLQPIKKVVSSGVVPFIVRLLDRESCPQLQFEAAWALSKIVSLGTSNNAKMVVDLGAVPIFVKLLSLPTEDVRKQAVQALGSMALKSEVCRDKVLEHGAVVPLLQLLNVANPRLSLLRAISNLCRGSPAPNFEHVSKQGRSQKILALGSDAFGAGVYYMYEQC